MDCSRVRQRNVVSSYLLGRLDEPERTAFEDHVIACAACFEELAGLHALQEELERSRDRIVAEPGRSSRARPRAWLLAVAAAVIAAAVGAALWSRYPPASTPRPEVAELAVFEPPPYATVRLRGHEDDAARRFAEAMEHYAAGDWRGALPGLRAAAALDPEAAHIAFYLGACALLAGDTDEAMEALGRTVALGDTLFLEEARFALAKAHLRQGDLPSARDELVEVVALDGDRLNEARTLLVRIEALGGGPS